MGGEGGSERGQQSRRRLDGGSGMSSRGAIAVGIEVDHVVGQEQPRPIQSL